MGMEFYESMTALNAAADLAKMIHEYILQHEALRTMGITAVGLATEMMLCQLAEEVGRDSDKVSEEYRNCLALWHKNVKQVMDFTNTNPKAN